MSSAKLTLIGLQKYMNDFEDDLFKNIVLPEGIDKDIFTNNVLLRGGEFEVMYPDPLFLQDAITFWSKKWYRTFNKWVEALDIEYAPLENYDRFEDFTDQTNRGLKTEGTRNSNNEKSFDDYHETTVTETEVSAYDSSNYQPSEQVTATETPTGKVKDQSGEGTKGSETENTKFTHGGRTHGNVGVTTSQEMLDQELKIQEWNIYEHMTDIFLSEFVIPIYS